jgi:hypothetical protein
MLDTPDTTRDQLVIQARDGRWAGKRREIVA